MTALFPFWSLLQLSLLQATLTRFFQPSFRFPVPPSILTNPLWIFFLFIYFFDVHCPYLGIVYYPSGLSGRLPSSYTPGQCLPCVLLVLV